MSRRSTSLDAHVARRLRTVDALLVHWRAGTPAFDAAVDETVRAHGYAESDVVAQLEHLAQVRCTGEALERSLLDECGGVDLRARAPREILHLVAATVPGLALESVLVGYVLGATSQLRPSREETVLPHAIGHAAAVAPELLGTIDLVDSPRWQTPDAAVVYGSDETVALVRARMGERPVDSYGSRRGIALVTATAPAGWARALADDVITFRQRGYMSPSLVLAVDVDVEQMRRDLSSALESQLPLHEHPAVLTPAEQRQRVDQHELASIHGAVAAGPAWLDVEAVREADVIQRLDPLRPLLQTAVLACDAKQKPHFAGLLRAAGCTRVCQPGSAHFPPPEWPHDGIGRFAPLLGEEGSQAVPPQSAEHREHGRERA